MQRPSVNTCSPSISVLSRRVCTDLEFLRFDGGGARPADVTVAEVAGGVKVLLGGDVARVGALLGDLRLRREEEQRQFRTRPNDQ